MAGILQSYNEQYAEYGPLLVKDKDGEEGRIYHVVRDGVPLWSKQALVAKGPGMDPVAAYLVSEYPNVKWYHVSYAPTIDGTDPRLIVIGACDNGVVLHFGDANSPSCPLELDGEGEKGDVPSWCAIFSSRSKAKAFAKKNWPPKGCIFPEGRKEWFLEFFGSLPFPLLTKAGKRKSGSLSGGSLKKRSFVA